jgi:hypothetical protein
MLKSKKFPPKADPPMAEKSKIIKILIIACCFCNLQPVTCSLLFAQDQFVYDPKGKRDPFIPLVTPEGRLLNLDTEQSKGTLNLEGIIYDEKGISYAIVNGAVVKIGDTIEGSQVLKIENNKVVFIKDGNPFEQELKEEVK